MNSSTLIEVLLVIAIISLLAFVVLQGIAPKRVIIRAQDTAREHAAQQLENAVNQHAIDNSTPIGDNQIGEGKENGKPICRQGVRDPSCVDASAIVGLYLPSIPRDGAETDPRLSGYELYKEKERLFVATSHLGEPGGSGVENTAVSFGPVDAGWAEEDPDGEGVPWNNAGSAAGSDDQYASTEPPDGIFSRSLIASQFGLDIPEGATITGIVVEIERRSAGGTPCYVDVRLVSGETILGDDQTSFCPQPAETGIFFGNNTDTWGASLTPADVNAPSFGIAFTIVGSAGGSEEIDSIRMIVFYVPATTIGQASPSSGSSVSSSSADSSSSEYQGGGGTSSAASSTSSTTLLSNIARVYNGDSQTLVVKTNGSAWAWGGNNGGELGDGSYSPHAFAIPVLDIGGVTGSTLTGVAEISAGVLFSVARKTDGTVVAWGANDYGQLGDGTTSPRTSPVQVKDVGGEGVLSDVVKVAAGGRHAFAIKANGTVVAWGANDYGQLGDGTTSPRTSPVQVKDVGGEGVLSDVVAIAVGALHSVAVRTDGTVVAWGRNANGQLGDGTTMWRTSPVDVKDVGGEGALSGVAGIAAGFDYTAAAKTDGSVVTWGNNWYGQLGNDSTTESDSPVQVKDVGGTGTLSGVAAVTAGYAHVIALKTDGTVVSWGWNFYGQLGDGTDAERHVPVQVFDPAMYASLTGQDTSPEDWDAGKRISRHPVVLYANNETMRQ